MKITNSEHGHSMQIQVSCNLVINYVSAEALIYHILDDIALLEESYSSSSRKLKEK